MTLPGAIAGMAVGALTVIIWEIGGFLGLYSIVPGFIFSAIAIFVVSMLTYKQGNECETLFKELEKKFWVEVKEK